MMSRELYPFTLLLPRPFEGDFYDRKNESTQELKDYLRTATGNSLRPNILGQLASGLVHGQMFRIGNDPKPGLYELAEGGRGITFNDPVSLYERWPELEKKVGPALQVAMRQIIDYATER